MYGSEWEGVKATLLSTPNRRLAQRWDSSQALLSVCPTVVAFLPILFRLKQIYLKN
ncbi:hypothetical protein AmaxDRAFT_1230 [Limnospira maxima CS-328]|uniref:Uncharacterized protein n=1 Tax=Limnospira maxima CS-328 TaxID=513049 RepID=B5VXI8_LIMMA|nr:hypothetical protein AmaxDRAFT_1230 [Limnospira maxima CS-328]